MKRNKEKMKIFYFSELRKTIQIYFRTYQKTLHKIMKDQGFQVSSPILLRQVIEFKKSKTLKVA